MYGGHSYRGHLAWEGGRWHHQVYNGRMGWWWDVGGVWYFYPQRFDRTFLSMLDRFHETYPQVGLHMMLHFEHPDEILAKDAEGNSLEDAQG